MMSVALLLLGALGLLTLPALALGRWTSLRPVEQARLNTGALVGGVVLLEAALIVCAWPTVARLFGSTAGQHFFPGGAFAGWASTSLALAMPMRATYGLADLHRRTESLRAEPWVGDHFEWANIDIVLLESDLPLALVLPGNPPQMILTRGLTDTLNEDELRAVILHESAHLSLRHPRYLLVAAALYPVLGWLSPLRSSISALEVSVECWADSAAAPTEDARCATRNAILALASPALGPGIAAMSGPDGISHRLGALESARTDRPGWRRVIPYLTVAGLFVVALFALMVRI